MAEESFSNWTLEWRIFQKLFKDESRKIGQFVLVSSRQYLFVQTKNEFGKISARLILVCIEKVFNFWSRFPVNVCGRHSKWARDRSLKILALQNLSHFSTVSTASKIEPGFDDRRNVFFNEDEKIKLPPITYHSSPLLETETTSREFQRLNTRFNFVRYIFKLFSILLFQIQFQKNNVGQDFNFETWNSIKMILLYSLIKNSTRLKKFLNAWDFDTLFKLFSQFEKNKILRRNLSQLSSDESAYNCSQQPIQLYTSIFHNSPCWLRESARRESFTVPPSRSPSSRRIASGLLPIIRKIRRRK